MSKALALALSLVMNGNTLVLNGKEYILNTPEALSSALVSHTKSQTRKTETKRLQTKATEKPISNHRTVPEVTKMVIDRISARKGSATVAEILHEIEKGAHAMSGRGYAPKSDSVKQTLHTHCFGNKYGNTPMFRRVAHGLYASL